MGYSLPLMAFKEQHFWWKKKSSATPTCTGSKWDVLQGVRREKWACYPQPLSEEDSSDTLQGWKYSNCCISKRYLSVM